MTTPIGHYTEAVGAIRRLLDETAEMTDRRLLAVIDNALQVAVAEIHARLAVAA